ncbi:MAG: ATP-dependent RecD-like DNA helicase [Planctomycetota bacterium]
MGSLFQSEVELVGEIQDVIYENSENGYAVVRLRVQGQALPVTATGTLFGLAPGARVRLFGEYKEHPRFGRQLNATRHEELIPKSRAGMAAFLASQFKGIGPKLAERIVNRFGERTYEILDADVMEIAKVPGVGRATAKAVAEQWESRKGIREAATFLQGYGVGPGQAARVFRHYGDATVALVKSNPFRLADEVRGIGFRTADRIAQSLGIPKESPERAQAALLYLLSEATGQGHLLLPIPELLRRAEALEVPSERAEEALAVLIERGEIVREEQSPTGNGPLADASGDPREAWDRRGPVAYSLRLHRDEWVVEAVLTHKGRRQVKVAQFEKKLEAVARRAGIVPSEEQALAVRAALSHEASVITGGPGVGKTTIVRLLVDLLVQRSDEVVLAAPTGRAAKRLSEATGRPASTIHRLLAFDPFTGMFGLNEENPIDADHLVVDECSMLDVPLAASLLRALKERARLTLVGDADQLPSVGPGDFFRAVCASDAIPLTRLTTVYRQREGSRIVQGAHSINRGRFPEFDPRGPGGEFYFVPLEDAQEVAEMIRTLVVDRIPDSYGFDPRFDIQVLTPMHRGASGAENLNAMLGAALNPHPPAEIRRGDRTFRVGDRIVQIKNDYENFVFNGDQGFIVACDPEQGSLVARIDDREVKYEREGLNFLLPAWATTVHRAQGGEYSAVVLALTGQHFPLLRRNLIYTAVTRARKLCVIVGSRRALEMAIANATANDRYSWLEERLRAAAPGGEP